jgi:hypothetical protein
MPRKDKTGPQGNGFGLGNCKIPQDEAPYSEEESGFFQRLGRGLGLGRTGQGRGQGQGLGQGRRTGGGRGRNC